MSSAIPAFGTGSAKQTMEKPGCVVELAVVSWFIRLSLKLLIKCGKPNAICTIPKSSPLWLVLQPSRHGSFIGFHTSMSRHVCRSRHNYGDQRKKDAAAVPMKPTQPGETMLLPAKNGWFLQKNVGNLFLNGDKPVTIDPIDDCK